jgi:hypothetical protein
MVERWDEEVHTFRPSFLPSPAKHEYIRLKPSHLWRIYVPNAAEAPRIPGQHGAVMLESDIHDESHSALTRGVRLRGSDETSI